MIPDDVVCKEQDIKVQPRGYLKEDERGLCSQNYVLVVVS